MKYYRKTIEMYYEKFSLSITIYDT